ncbi:MAG: hypothetical protein Q8K32_14845 [Archangium sp.]|nr:hypothetical protein [Archangium sp.]
MSTPTREEILERRATLARERLLAVVDELDRKRHEFAHDIAHPRQLVSEQLAKRLMPKLDAAAGTIAAISGTVLIAGGAIGYLVYRRNHTWSRRLLARLPRPQPKPSFWGDVFSRSAKALLAFGLVQGLKYAIREGAKRANAQIPAQ